MYKQWKSSLKGEVEGLKRSSQDFLMLLSLRTQAQAAEVVKRSKHIAAESPNVALRFAWELLDDRFASHPKAAKDHMK